MHPFQGRERGAVGDVGPGGAPVRVLALEQQAGSVPPHHGLGPLRREEVPAGPGHVEGRERVGRGVVAGGGGRRRRALEAELSDRAPLLGADP